MSAAPSRAARALHPVERAVRWLLAAMDRLDLPYAVLRGDRDLPRLEAQGALDLACAPRHLSRVTRLLERAAARYGVAIVARRATAHARRLQLHGVDEYRRHRHLCLCVRSAETYLGVPIIESRDLLQGRSRRHGHARPDPVVSAVADVLGPYLGDGGVSEDAFARLATVMEQLPMQTRGLLGSIFGTAVAEEVRVALQDASRAHLFRVGRRARRAVLARALASAPLETVWYLVRHALEVAVLPLLAPRGVVVAVVGADGAGKTTLIEAIRRELTPALRAADDSVVRVNTGRSHVVDVRRASAPAAWLRAARITAGHVWDWWLRVAPRRRSHTVVLLDGYVDDVLVDPARFGVTSPSHAVRWLAQLAPRPDVTLVCIASPRELEARRSPVDRDEAVRQLEAYASLARSRPDVTVVWTNGTLEDSLDRALSAIYRLDEPRSPEHSVAARRAA